MHPPESDEAAPPPIPPQPRARPARRLPRALSVTLATAGLLAVTATAATVTVAVGRPARPAAQPQAAAATPATPSPPPTAEPSVTTAAPPPPTASPTPHPTVTGRVSGDAHTGDLRFFLLPVPEDAEVYGDPAGTRMSLETVAKGFGNTSETKRILDDYDFHSAAYRTYRTQDGSAEVTSRLIRFGNATKANWFVTGMSMHGTPFSVPGVDGARGFLFKPEQPGGTGSLIGLFHQGDVEVEISVDVKGVPDKSVLTGLIKRQQQRLRTGH
ncbi:hypothetical protein ACIQGZ_01810 [Streptomyces sp. NPDC092296]|uniref:hypothetical protein n=1 Tax=Streptomyces sp. NPDC092296 TaxID=3366012 RepID=UPI003801A992